MVYILIFQFSTDSSIILFITLPAWLVYFPLPIFFFQLLLAKHFVRLLEYIRLYKIHLNCPPAGWNSLQPALCHS